MAKQKITYFCSECGYESAKWMGQCPSCGNWNTFVEQPAVSAGSFASRSAGSGTRGKRPSRIREISADEEPRFSSGFAEMDRALGGGIVQGSLILLGGDPGIGKSTLLMQVCRSVSAAGRKVLYVSGEESLRQMRMRADRLGDFSDQLFLLCETDITSIEETVRQEMPAVLVIDSIQTMYSPETASAPGSVSQVRDCTGRLLMIAKSLGITVFIVGHVTKEGMVAGPKMLEHMVDTVLYFEGDRSLSYRMLRAAKNRFGPANEIGVFEMVQEGLREVKNPSSVLLEGRPENVSGAVTTCVMEGNTPMLLEVQALVCPTSFSIPRRTAAGMDFNRVSLLMAVLEKRMGLGLGNSDVYINVTGGMRITEPSADLAVVAAVISSQKDICVSTGTIVFGEVGLAGEARRVGQVQKRLSEAAKLGFSSVILPRASLKNVMVPDGLMAYPVENVREMYSVLMSAASVAGK
ncbi:MAG: DNA repair protein RadA [Lachnospiraceae bacterium]|jgi:DNA repair protein RadA/Sms